MSSVNDHFQDPEKRLLMGGGRLQEILKLGLELELDPKVEYVIVLA